jgi:hypothetical protein
MTDATVDAPLDLGRAWRRAKLPVVLAVLFLATAVFIAIVRNAPPQRPLDPRDASPVGSRALAELLGGRGVTVVPTADPASVDAAGTVFVPDPGSLTGGSLSRLAGSVAELVVVAPGPRELAALDVDAHAAGGADGTLFARCAFAPAYVAGPVEYDGPLYAGPDAGESCYASGSAAGLLVVDRDDGRTVVFGSADTFTNRLLDDEGDAALALGLLETRPTLTWLLPQPPTRGAADGRQKGLLDLLPERLLWALLMLVVTAGVVALWRARRLGAVVVEPLPVVVRATETVEGRARLLRTARARDTAATALREASLARLRDLLGLGADASPTAVVEATATRTGRSGGDVQRLLFGAPPSDDATLVRLANELTGLEESVRRT